jgi:hypothetical protein
LDNSSPNPVTLPPSDVEFELTKKSVNGIDEQQRKKSLLFSKEKQKETFCRAEP